MRTDLRSAPSYRALAALAGALLCASSVHAQGAAGGGLDPAAPATTAAPAVPPPPMAAPPATLDPTAAATVVPPATPVPENAAVGPRLTRRVRFVATVGYDYGFEEFFTTKFEGGGSDRLAANGGYVFSVGAAYLPLASDALELRATAGLKFESISASNGSASYVAFPIELLVGWNIERVRLSAGPSLSLAPRVRGDEFFDRADLDLKNSLGLVTQAEYVFPFRGASGFFSVGVRFLLQKLEPKRGGGSADANALGAFAGVAL